ELGPTSGPGRAFVYLGTAQGLSSTHAWTHLGDDLAGAGFGFSVAGAGDVNGDGFGDLIVGAYLHTFTYQASGRAFLFLGGAGGPAATASWSASGDAQAYAQFGFSVAGAGDVDADGFDDVVVGAPGHDTAQGGAGRAYAYRGGVPGTGLSTAYWWRYSGTDRAQARFGWSVAGVGDANGDGKADVLVGAPGEDTLGTAVGRAFMYLGSLSGPLTPPAWSASGDEQVGASFGSCVAPAGDVNADGAADLLASAPYQDIPGQDGGRAFLYLGVEDGPGLCEPVGSGCDDLDPCTYPDLCDAAGACHGTPFSCDDQNPCSTDECRPDGSCGHLHSSDPCDDSNPCTEGDTCSAAQCMGTPRDCSWLDGVCSQGSCDAASGTCQALSRADGTPCDDGDACTAGDACRGGNCVPVQDLCAEGDSGCASAGGAGAGPGCSLLLGLLLLGLRGRRISRARSPGSACSPGRPASAGRPHPA
ncbi:MAG TPA: integrin alpha, partial [Myxococcota bacterium]|nr:integrin alpha [Myxococcota bacterium]